MKWTDDGCINGILVAKGCSCIHNKMKWDDICEIRFPLKGWSACNKLWTNIQDTDCVHGSWNLPDEDDESLLLDDSPLLESLDSLLSLLDELDECRLRLFDFFFLPFFELLPSLRLSAFVLPLIADDVSPRLWSAILILSAAKIDRNKININGLVWEINAPLTLNKTKETNKEIHYRCVRHHGNQSIENEPKQN